MNILIGTAVVAGVFALAGPVAISPAAAASQAKVQTTSGSVATDFSARRYYRHHHDHYGYRAYDRPAYQPYYYGRPTYYRPYPYAVPAPFPFGIGFGPFWW